MTDPVTTETTLAQAVGAAISARNVAVTAKNDAVDAKVETEALVEIARGLKNNASDAAASAATALSGVDAAIATALDGAVASATAEINADLADFRSRYLGPFSSTPTYVGDTAPWSIGALYWNRLQTKFFVWNGSGWDATDATAQAAASAAAGSAGTAAAIAAGLSASGYTLDGIDAQRVGAIISAPKGLFMLDGAQVSLSSLLSFSSAAKYTVGPDGNYILNAANGPAWDWSTGRRRLLIEAIGATNLWPYSEALDATYTGNQFSVANSANSLFGTLNRATLTATSANAAVYSGYGYLSVVAGDVVTFTAAIKNGTGQFVNGGLYGVASGWGADGDTTCVVLSGPGTVSRNGGGLWDFSGVTSDTVIRWTRTYRATESAVPFLYTNCAIGQTVSVGCIQLERGYGSSYTPTGASATDRPPDIVTAASGLLALLQAGGTLIVRGRGRVGVSGIYPIIGSTNRYASVEVSAYGAFASSAAIDILNAVPPAPPMTDFGIAASWTAGQRKLAVNGGAVVVDNAALFSASDAGVQLFHGVEGYANGELDELVFIPAYATNNSSLAAQARVYS